MSAPSVSWSTVVTATSGCKLAAFTNRGCDRGVRGAGRTVSAGDCVAHAREGPNFVLVGHRGVARRLRHCRVGA